MKCQYCGGNLSLEAEKCPHCGKINIHAQQHIKDMRDYQDAFADTQSDVYRVARNHSGIAVRAVIISVLLLLIVTMIFCNAQMYSIKYDLRESEANRKAKQYKELLEEYLEEENYQAFGAFCNAYNISGYGDAYEEYRPIINVTREYAYLYRYIMELKTAQREYMYDSSLESIGRTLDTFYEYMVDEKYNYGVAADNAETRKTLQVIEEKAEALLIVYCGLTEEEAASLKELSSAKRMVLIEERMQYGEWDTNCQTGNH